MEGKTTANRLVGWAVGVTLLALAAGVVAYAISKGWAKGSVKPTA